MILSVATSLECLVKVRIFMDQIIVPNLPNLETLGRGLSPHLMPTLFKRPDIIKDPLYVVTTVFNAERFRVRWKLYQDWELMVRRAGAIPVTVEVAFGDRAFVVTQPDDPFDVQLRSPHQIWLKENALNIGFSRLPQDWKYAGYLDADVLFARPDWANEIIHQLQHFRVVQPFSQSIDLTPKYEIMRIFRSYMWCFVQELLDNPSTVENYYGDIDGHGGKIFPHPGYGMFFRRDAFNALGGLIDWCVLGGADLWMCYLLAGRMRKFPDSLGDSGKRWLKIWGDRAIKHINHNIGFVDGLLIHYFHGAKKKRRYKDRGAILVEGKFDPEIHLYKDYQGLWQLSEEAASIRDGARQYFRERDEDNTSIDEEEN